MIDALFGEPAVQAVAWALLQFVWQGAIVGLVTGAVLSVLRRSAPDVRYVVGTIALALMFTLPIVTTMQRYAALTAQQGQASIPATQARSLAPDTATPDTTADRHAPAAASSAALPSASSRASAIVRPERLLPIVMIVWVAGVTVLSLRLFTGWLWIRRMRTHGVVPADGSWDRMVQRLARQLHIVRRIASFESTLVDVPTVVGWLKPVVLMPVSAIGGLAPQQLEAILAHELAHIRRHDYAVNLLQTLVETLLFYHPAVWWVSRRIRAERENCCDDLAVALCGDPVAYASALADLESLRSSVPPFRRLERTALAATGGSLLQRVRRLLGAPTHAPVGPTWLAGTAALVVIACLAFSVDGVRAQQPSTPATVFTQPPTPTDRGPSAITQSPDQAQRSAQEQEARARAALARAQDELVTQSRRFTVGLASADALRAAEEAMRAAQADAAAAESRLTSSVAVAVADRSYRDQQARAQAALASAQDELTKERVRFDAGLADAEGVRAAAEAMTRAQAQVAAAQSHATSAAAAVVTQGDAVTAQAQAADAAVALAIPSSGQSISSNQSNASGNWSWSNNGEHLEVTYSGSSFDFTDDDTDIRSMSPGALFRISDGAWFGRHSVEIREHDGQLERHYYVNGAERPYEPEGRQWLHDHLPKFVRNTGIAAPSRVARLLKTGGPAAVLGEISQVDGAYVKGIYYRELFKQVSLTPAQYRQVLSQAGREMRGNDYTLGQLLIAIADKLPDDDSSRDAYFAAASGLSSAYEIRRVYTAMLKRAPVSDRTLVGILDHVGTMNSDYDRSELLRAILSQQALDDRTRAPFFRAMEGLRGDYERHRVLSAALERSTDRATVEFVLTNAGKIGSDYEKSTLLQQVLKSSSIEGSLRTPFFAAANSLDSSYERGRVLQAVARRDDASDDTIRAVLDSAGRMSGYDLSQVLITVARSHTLSGSLREAYVQDADKLSGYDQGQVMTALVRAERRR